MEGYLDRLWEPSPADQFVGWLREEPCWAEKESLVNGWVERYLPNCPDNPDKFIEELRTSWPGSSWQMYLWLLLHAQGYDLKAASPKGPDITLDKDGRRVWVECIAPGVGTGELQAEPLPTGRVIAGDPNGEKIIFRITAALADKAAKTREYVDAGLISAYEPILVAVSLALVSNSGTSRLENYCLKALHGTGQSVFMVPIGDPPKPIRLEQRYQSEIAKPSGAQVPLVPFASLQYRWISGLLMNPFDVVFDPELCGSDLWFFPNLLAHNKLPDGFFRFGTEVRSAEDGSLQSVRHQQETQGAKFGGTITAILRELAYG